MSKITLAIDPGCYLQLGRECCKLRDGKTTRPSASSIAKRFWGNKSSLLYMWAGISLIHQATETWAKEKKFLLFSRVLLQKHERGSKSQLQRRPALRCLREANPIKGADILLQSLPQEVDQPKTKGQSNSVEAESEYEEGGVVIPQKRGEERKEVAILNGLHRGKLEGAPCFTVYGRHDVGKLWELLAYRSHKACRRIQLPGSRRSGLQGLLEPVKSPAAQG